MRIVAIDFGTKRIGIAMTDTSKIIAYPFKTIQALKTFDKTIDSILDVLKNYLKEIELFIIGLPLSLKGEKSDMAKMVLEFVKVFETKTKVPIKLVDERLTSVSAERHLKENFKMSRKKRSKKVDPIAATILLKTYLDSLSI